MIVKEYIYIMEYTDDGVWIAPSTKIPLIRCGNCALAQEIYDFDNLLSKDWIWCPKNKRTKSVKGYCSEAISKEDSHDTQM